MSQENGKGQRPLEEGKNDNDINFNALTAELDTMKEENKALKEKLQEAEEKAQMAKNELEEFIRTSRQQKQETTSGSRGLELNLELLEITQNSLDPQQRVLLPLELNCQIFECLKFGIQRKFIGGLGRGIYAIFRQKVLTKSKRLLNPKQNGWNVSNTDAIISFNGLVASDITGIWWTVVYARKRFPISGQLSRADNFPGTVIHYFEVAQIADITKTDNINNFGHSIGLSDGNNSDGFSLGFSPNSYKFSSGSGFCCFLAGERFEFEWPNGFHVVYKSTGDTIGCGLLLNPENKVFIFFTLNGILLGIQISINPSVDCLFPTVCMCNISVEANFGTDPAKPFEYNIEKCPGMGYDDD